MDTKGLKASDVVRVNVDWAPEIKNKRATIFSFQQNGEVFANLVWARDHQEMERKYGSKFAVSELVKV